MRATRTAKATAVTFLAAGSLFLGLEAAAGAAISASQDVSRPTAAAAGLPGNDFGRQFTPVEASENDFGWQ